MDRCRLVTAATRYQGRQGLEYAAGISAESAGARALCLHLLTIPPGGRAKAHLHQSHESAIYLVSGTVEVWHGPQLAEQTMMSAGDFFYIPAGVPHVPVNLSHDQLATAVIARTDPNEQESVVLLPELDALVE
jgi:uncharacterized RmlC-like cupin family protein